MTDKKVTDFSEGTGPLAATDWLSFVKAAASPGSRDFKFKMSRLLVDATTIGTQIATAANAGAVNALLGLGTLALQAASAIAVTGGTINGTVIGGSSPAAGHFTTADFTDLVAFCSQTSITAFAGGGHASATALTKSVNRLGTVASDADSVKLPPWVAGTVVVIWNTSAHSAQIFGAGTDTINEVATDTGVALAAGKTGIYFASAATGKWSGGALA